jgi:hypothetical protein
MAKYFVITPGSAPAEVVEFKYRKHKLYALRIRWSNNDPNYIKTIPYHRGLKIVTARPPLVKLARKIKKYLLKKLSAALAWLKRKPANENK